MSIVVSHQPDLAVTSEIAYQSGKGQYNQWLAQFQQQQENAKTQALMGGFSAGGRLGLGIANMQSRERMQTERLVAGTAKAAAQMDDDAKFATVMGDRLIDAAAMRDPLNPMGWRDSLKMPRAEQEKLLRWADDVAKNRAMYKQHSSPGAVNARVKGGVADGQAIQSGNDAYTTQRQSIDHEFKKGHIDAPMRARMHRLVDRNARMFGNKPVRPLTADEANERQWTTPRDLPGGATSTGYIDKEGQYHEVYRSPTILERKEARTARLVAGATSITAINKSIAALDTEMEPEPANEQLGTKERPVDPATMASLQSRKDALVKIRDALLKEAMKSDTGFIEDLPPITQNWMHRIAENPNFETEAQKQFVMMKQRLQPDSYILDNPKYMHFRMGKGQPWQRWDTGSHDPIAPRGDQISGPVGTPSRSAMLSGRFQPQGATQYDIGMAELNAPPPPTDELYNLGRETPSYELHEPGVPPGPDPPPPPPGTAPPPGTVPRPGAGVGKPKTQAELAAEAPGVQDRLQKMGDAGIAREVQFQKDTKLFDESSAARRVAVKQAHGAHVRIRQRKPLKTTGVRGAMRRTAGRKVQSTGEVDALIPRPARLSKEGTGFEVQFDRLYNAFPTVQHRTQIRFIQSMLRKYGYSHATMRSQASAHEQAAWHDAMKVVKQLSDSMKRR